MSLRIEDGPANDLALLFYGVHRAPQPAFDGAVCFGRPSYRLTQPFSLDANGAASININWNSGAHTSPGASGWTTGATWAVQAIYRDPGGPGGTGFNWISAWRAVFLPGDSSPTQHFFGIHATVGDGPGMVDR